MFKKIVPILVCGLMITGLSACNQSDNANNNNNSDGRIKVSATFDAMREFAAVVGGDKVDISTIIPDGSEPHDFEPKAQDIEALSSADVFVYNGLGMESWADDAVQSADNPKLVVVDASKGAVPIDLSGKAEAGDGQYDPHIWLSLKGAEIEVKNIKDGLVRADPANKDFYEKNCDEYTARLESLFHEYDQKFGSVQNKNIVTGHAAFAYLCRDFGLTQNSVEDVFAEGEPGAQQLARLVDYCKKNDVKTIFAEQMASPAVSQTLADEVGAKVETIYTIESSENGKAYYERMQSDLSEIYESLK